MLKTGKGHNKGVMRRAQLLLYNPGALARDSSDFYSRKETRIFAVNMRVDAPDTTVVIEYNCCLMAGCNLYDKIRTVHVLIGLDVLNAAGPEGFLN